MTINACAHNDVSLILSCVCVCVSCLTNDVKIDIRVALLAQCDERLVDVNSHSRNSSGYVGNHFASAAANLIQIHVAQ